MGALVERTETGATVSVEKEFQVSTRKGDSPATQEVYKRIQCNRPKTWIAISQEVLEENLRADLEEGYQLTIQGKVFLVDCGTSVKVLDQVQQAVKVQILEGEYKGRVGWTTTVFVKVP